MPFFILGINHNTAPVDIRERIVFDESVLPDALEESGSLPGINENVIVSTCNRTEIVCDLEQEAETSLVEWLHNFHGMDERLAECLFQAREEAAARHLFRVACGLDSVILGEPQITGQLKDAFRHAQGHGRAGPRLTRLFQHAFSVAKKVRTDTTIGSSPVSVAYAAVSLARQIFSRFEKHTALLVGAGETIELVARHLHSHGIGRLFIANRSLPRARALAAEFGGFALPLSELPGTLPEADILISSTASPDPLISAADMKRALELRKRKPIFACDIAVPRDIEPEVAKFEDVYLYTVDDLQGVINDGLQSRKAAADEAERIIEFELERFRNAERVLDAVPIIKSIRGRGEELKQEVLEQAMRRLANSGDPEAALQFLASTLMNKMLHKPSERLRQAGEESDEAIMLSARELFGLNDGKKSRS